VKPKELLPAELQPGDSLQVLGALVETWEQVTAEPKPSVEGFIVQTERTEVVIAPRTKCRVKRRAA
jgi:hypothetical protein